MEPQKLEIGQTLTSSFNNIEQWPIRFLILIAMYTIVGTAIDTATNGAGYNISNLLGMIITLLVSQAALRARYPDYDGGLRFGGFIALSILSNLGIILGILLLIIPGIMLYVRWAIALPVLMREDIGATAAMSRSSDLTVGNRWAVLGLSLLMIVPPVAGAFAMAYVAETFAPGGSSTLAANIVLNLGVALFTNFAAVCWVETYARLSDGTGFGEDLAEVFA